MIMIFGTFVLNDDISRLFFPFFEIFSFWAVRGEKGQKIAQDDKISLPVEFYFSGSIHHISGVPMILINGAHV